jgi:hypothetical protein
MSRLVAAVLALVLGGCVSLTPGQESTLADWKAFAHRVTQHYGKTDVYIMVGQDTGVATMRHDGIMVLGQEVLVKGQTIQIVLAHELGHHVLGHRGGCGIPCELDANAEAVKILVIGSQGAIDEIRALNIALIYLRYMKGRQDNGLPVSYGHAPACQEIADLAARYSQYQVKTC